MAVRVVTRRPC